MYRISKYLATRVSGKPGALAPYSWGFTRKSSSDPVHEVPVHYETSLHKDASGAAKEKIFPDSADVVVIGGGSVGCSTAYHLAKLNAGKVVLLEKESLTSGTTWHTAGIVFNLRDGRTLTQMQLQTRDLLTNILPEETGFDAGWIETGKLFITRNRDQLDGLEKKSLICSDYGIETRMVDLDEISRLHPLMNTKGIIGAIYSPHDGSLDPATLCTSYIKAATKYGAQVFEKCKVTDIKTSHEVLGLRKVTAVETNLGTIRTNNVVNCTGAWAPYVAKMVGIKLPQVTYKHTYVITQGIPGIEKTPHVRDTESRMYYKRQGDALLFGGYEVDPDFVGLAPEEDFSFGLYDMNWEKFEQFIESATDLVPSIGKVGIRSTVCGPEAFTSDSRPLMGETSQLKGFFIGSAFNSGGMMMGGGAGRQLAHWVVNGSPEYDMHECDINRFTRKYDDTWVIHTSHDRFTTRFDVDHPRRQELAGRNLRTTPLTKQHISNGAYMNSVHGWEVPMYFLEGQQFLLLEYDFFGLYGKKKHENYPYRDQMARDTSFKMDTTIHDQIVRESLACYKSVGVVDLTHLSKFSISGTKADFVVRRLFSSDVAKMGENCSADTLLLDGRGKIVAHVNVTKLQGSSYMITGAAELQGFILKHINHYFLDDNIVDCEFKDVTDNHAILHVIGPQSVNVLKNVVPAFQEDLQASMMIEAKIGNKSVTLKKLSNSPDVCSYEIQCAMENLDIVYDSLMNSEIKPSRIGLRAFNSVLLETGRHNLSSSRLAGVTPLEANLERFCPLDGDRDYIGKSALLDLLDKPLKAKLVRLTAASEFPILPHDVIWRNGVYAGLVGDSAYGCNSGKYHITSYLKPQFGDFVTEELLSSENFTVGRRSRKTDADVLKYSD